ncbi:hypothetical protein D8674_010916 [Pyrus ussuriensis x Pyrus communis]|uniref:histidinol-phosphate transaminase n=1 Tax=Pyrus ussuriensis x Pyrus communis TaxID=2448454 RepID=A0A5N5FX84_9ROSA|nr:hypothetical protein D8674_010916 [Pyrus ussuriensis x Pyrus communis]
MASTIPVQHKQVNDGQQRLTGDSFIRPHLRNLSPYQPILPFENLSVTLRYCIFMFYLFDDSIISDEILLKILELPILVVLDEAYIEFSGLESRMQWVKKHENLIVLRTFSKRAAFPLSIIEYLWRAKQPYNVSVTAEVSACAALQNPTYLERLFNLLKELPFLNPYPSYSNFILCEVTLGMDPKKLKEDLAKMGVMIRHYNNKELKGYVRISVGKPEHTDILIDCLRRLSP